MTTRIRILPEQLANQIAAGEVVERPASVVKELLENAIDAGSSELLIEVEQGGKKLIRVTDNGCGMGKEDLFLALERHATSKISSAAELFALQTLGFRGEALPSVASVARLRLTSRPAGAEHGWQLYAEGGTVRHAEALGVPAGTVVEVRDLFFNTPGRRKFLRSDETEFGHLADVVTRLALARPDIQVRLIHNGRTHLEAYRHQRLEERVAALLGRTLSGAMRPIDSDSGDGLLLGGLLGTPSVSRSTSGHLYTYVNGRFIRDRVVQHAILEGYRTLLEKGRFPVAVLFLDLPPELVDVNVHPTKHEVRFRERQQVHAFIAGAVRAALVEPTRVTAAAAPDEDPSAPSLSFPTTRAAAGIQEALSAYAARHQDPTPSSVHWQSAGKGTALSWPPPAGAEPLPAAPLVASPWRVIGQYLNSYLLCQDGDDLLLIDQHAAHERIGFEALRRQLREDGIETQQLLLPAVIECDHRLHAVITAHLADFARLGFLLEPFGGRDFTLLGLPQLLAGADPQRLVLDLAEELAQLGRLADLDSILDRVLMRLACHGMVRAGQALSRAEIESLLAGLAAVDFAAHCPHGRPVLKRLSRAEVERFFHRL